MSQWEKKRDFIEKQEKKYPFECIAVGRDQETLELRLIDHCDTAIELLKKVDKKQKKNETIFFRGDGFL